MKTKIMIIFALSVLILWATTAMAINVPITTHTAPVIQYQSDNYGLCPCNKRNSQYGHNRLLFCDNHT